MKNKIIEHYTKRIAIHKAKLHEYKQILRDSYDDEDETKMFWKQRVDKTLTTIKSLEEQLEYIKTNLQ